MIVDGQAGDSEQYAGVEAGHEQSHVLDQHSDETEQKAGAQGNTYVQTQKQTRLMHGTSGQRKLILVFTTVNINLFRNLFFVYTINTTMEQLHM